MKKLKILSIFGTRPEAIKMAPLAKLLESDPDIDSQVCVTGQHRQMLDQVLKLFSVQPSYDLNIMKPSQELSSVYSAIIEGVAGVLKDFRPHAVLIHGDTATTLASALSAYLHQIPIGHVEAGLRTGNLYSPWPEEGNRKLVGGLARWHFVPTHEAQNNLLREGIAQADIHITGNTVIDALRLTCDKIRQDHLLRAHLEKEFSYLKNPRSVLVTGHRRESFGIGFERICKALSQLAQENPTVDFIYPVHLNPQVREPVYRLLVGIKNIYLIEPLDYLPFVFLMTKAELILTDSGGIQEEAPWLGKPVLLMRETTERPEAVATGTVKLVGTDTEAIVRETQLLLTDRTAYEQMSKAINPYGDGFSCQRIVKILKNSLRV